MCVRTQCGRYSTVPPCHLAVQECVREEQGTGPRGCTEPLQRTGLMTYYIRVSDVKRVLRSPGHVDEGREGVSLCVMDTAYYVAGILKIGMITEGNW